MMCRLLLLALLLLRRLQIVALIVSCFTALLAKDLSGYFVNHRTCFPHRFHFWSSLAGPVLAWAGYITCCCAG